MRLAVLFLIAAASCRGLGGGRAPFARCGFGAEIFSDGRSELAVDAVVADVMLSSDDTEDFLTRLFSEDSGERHPVALGGEGDRELLFLVGV